jgi:hypothetical protein
MTSKARKKMVLLLFFLSVFSSVFFSVEVFAQQKGYQLLAGIPTITQPADGSAIPFPTYLKGLIVAIVGLSIIFAVIMIVIGGIEYVTAVVPSAKSEGKKKIIGAISGLLIAIFSYLLLITINPDLTIIGLDLNTVPASLYPPWEGGSSNSPEGHVGDPGVGGSSSGSSGSLGSGKCVPIHKAGNYCDVDALVPYFGVYAERMSAICNVESIGGQISIASGSDVCKDGNSFSFGLFQINLTVNDLGGLDCMYKHKPGVRAFTALNYDCNVDNQDMYDKCVAQAKIPEVNIAEAVRQFNQGGFNRWGANTRECHFRK